jgi:hypothetical protein
MNPGLFGRKASKRANRELERILLSAYRAMDGRMASRPRGQMMYRRGAESLAKREFFEKPWVCMLIIRGKMLILVALSAKRLYLRGNEA